MKAFIVYPTYRIIDDKAHVYLFGKLENGQSFLSISLFRPYFWVKKSQLEKALKIAEKAEIKAEKGKTKGKVKNFDDEDVGDSQNSYQVQIDDDSDIAASPLIDSCVPSLGTCGDGYTAQSYTPASPSSFDYNTIYYWRIKAWDNRGGESEWVESQFTTIEHETPDIDFTWTPLRPSRGEFAQFCATVEAGVCVSDVSKCYNALGQQISCSGNIFAWTFPPGTEFSTTTTAASENPQVNFPASGWQVVSLRINDGVGNCIATKDVRVAAPLPKWQETAP